MDKNFKGLLWVCATLIVINLVTMSVLLGKEIKESVSGGFVSDNEEERWILVSEEGNWLVFVDDGSGNTFETYTYYTIENPSYKIFSIESLNDSQRKLVEQVIASIGYLVPNMLTETKFKES